MVASFPHYCEAFSAEALSNLVFILSNKNIVFFINFFKIIPQKRYLLLNLVPQKINFKQLITYIQ